MSTTATPAPRQANAVRHYELPASALPWRCPMPDAPHWNSHPQVFLQPDGQGKARCPYCSAEFTLKS